MFTLLRERDGFLRFETHVPLSELTVHEAREALQALELLRDDLRQLVRVDEPAGPVTRRNGDQPPTRVGHPPLRRRRRAETS